MENVVFLMAAIYTGLIVVGAGEQCCTAYYGNDDKELSELWAKRL